MTSDGVGCIGGSKMPVERLREHELSVDRHWATALLTSPAASHFSSANDRTQADGVTVDVVTETVIGRDRADVAAYASDPSNAPEWYANIDSIEWETEPPVARGSRMAFVARFLGRSLTYTYEVVDLVPDGRLVMRTAHGPFPMETTYTWTTTPTGATRMTLRNRGEPAGFSTLTAPFMATAMRRANRRDLAKLKALLEERRETA